LKLTTLKQRSEFLRIRGGARCALPTFALEAQVRTEPNTANDAPRFGFTVTKALGNAVTRNRIRRRLKAAVLAVCSSVSKPGYDYVIIARSPAETCGFDQLKADFTRAFGRIHDPLRKPQSSGAGKRAR
jgi:ribonuclease P protein component